MQPPFPTDSPTEAVPTEAFTKSEGAIGVR